MDGRPRTDDGDHDSRGVGDPLLARRLLPPSAARDYRCDDARLALVRVRRRAEQLGQHGPDCLDQGTRLKVVE